MTLLKNSDGKILKNSGGSVLKQNYNVGNAFTPKSTTDNTYIRFYSLPLTPPYSIDLIRKGMPVAHNTGFMRVFDGVNPHLRYRKWNQNQNDVLLGGTRLYTGGGNEIDMAHLEVGVDGNNLQLYLGGELAVLNQTVSTRTNDLAPSGTCTLEINASEVSGRGGFKGGGVRVYTRHQLDSEKAYNANNNLFNDPLSTKEMLLRCRMNGAEALDFSALQDGSDMRPGVKDISGNNNHGEILGLPAGTLQEKIDYANQTYFKNFYN